MISSQLLFLFSALGAVNGIFLACYFFTRRTHRMANCMLGALLLAVGIRTVKSSFFYFNPDLAAGFLQIGISACLFIGPLTYLYVSCYLADLAQATGDKLWRWHLVPPTLIAGLGVFLPFSDYPYAWRCAITGIHVYWLGYLVLAGRLMWRAQAFNRQAILLQSVYFSSCVILVAYASTRFTSYIVGAISFTFTVHITLLTYFLRADAKPEATKNDKYQNRKLAEEDARAILDSLDELMHRDQLYLNPNLNLALVARKAGNLQTTISQVINDNHGKTFNLYINEFRIQHAKELLVRESHLNMELVAERSGFNSNSTFFSAFKKIVGQTPASYRAEFAS
ncbi:helix-turn-helix domain-containing protein [Massilia eburnea]|uniref:helix-turn-helix domain-containing protein n=1 Tax=Massilia eburnea TaxID=1776165 RepID=UPI003D6AA076